MVKYSTILNVIEKCLSKQRIQEKLALIDDADKPDLLKPLMNPGEAEEYEVLKFQHKLTLTRLSNYREDGYLPEDLKEEIINEELQKLEKQEKRIYMYEKRLFDSKFKMKEPKPVDYDLSKFKEDKQYGGRKDLYDPSTIGGLEQNIIDKQEQINFTDNEIANIHSYFGIGSRNLNSKLYNGEKWNKMPEEAREAQRETLDKRSRGLTQAINRTDGISENVVVYHGGPFDVTKVVGDRVVFKGFTSCSFQEVKSLEFGDGEWHYKICLPKGSKGLCGNAKIITEDGYEKTLSLHTDEHELLLNKNMSADIADIDYDKHLVTIVPVNTN